MDWVAATRRTFTTFIRVPPCHRLSHLSELWCFSEAIWGQTAFGPGASAQAQLFPSVHDALSLLAGALLPMLLTMDTVL